MNTYLRLLFSLEQQLREEIAQDVRKARARVPKGPPKPKSRCSSNVIITPYNQHLPSFWP
jgi:hypothetical protein